MHILLTRPFDDCKEMILKFKSLGHIVSHIPLLSVEKINHGTIDYLKYNNYVNNSLINFNPLPCYSLLLKQLFSYNIYLLV